MEPLPLTPNPTPVQPDAVALATAALVAAIAASTAAPLTPIPMAPAPVVVLEPVPVPAPVPMPLYVAPIPEPAPVPVAQPVHEPIHEPVYQPVHEPVYQPAYEPVPVAEPQAIFSFLTLVSALRKSGPYGLFALLGAAMLYGPDMMHHLLDAVNGVGAAQAHSHLVSTLAVAGDPAAAALLPSAVADATGAQNLADQQASGWPAPALVAGKLIISAAAYVFFTILRWLVQQLTHPVPTAWAKTGYSADFKALTAKEKFSVYGTLRLNSVLLAAAALLFASLIQ